MKEIRRNEFMDSMASISATGIIIEFPDLGMSLAPIEPVVKHVISVVREQQFGVLFSFHPSEITIHIDHPDHNTADQVARFISATSDVSHFYPEYPPMDRRPELCLWNIDQSRVTHEISVSGMARIRINRHMARHYPSQFPKGRRKKWVAIFDTEIYDHQSGIPKE